MEVKNIETFVANSVINYLQKRDDELNYLKDKIKKCCFCSLCENVHNRNTDCCDKCLNCGSGICIDCRILSGKQWGHYNGYFCSEKCEKKYIDYLTRGSYINRSELSVPK